LFADWPRETNSITPDALWVALPILKKTGSRSRSDLEKADDSDFNREADHPALSS
jgi:hypothetical protein